MLQQLTALFEGVPMYLLARDILLGLPNRDWDLVTPLKPVEVIEFLNSKNISSYQMNETFPTVCFLLDGKTVEITTFHRRFRDTRKEVTFEYCNTLEEDVMRRDFCINGIYLDLSTGQFVDPLNGLDDFVTGILTPINRENFIDDPLRLWRTIRLAKRWGLCLNAELAQILINYAEFTTRHIAIERIQEELGKMAHEHHFAACMELAAHTGLLTSILPEWELLQSAPYNKSFHFENGWAHTLRVLKLLDELHAPFEVKLAGLFHDMGKVTVVNDRGNAIDHEIASAEIAHTYLKAWKFSRQIIRDVTALVRWHMVKLTPNDTPKNQAKAIARLILERVNPKQFAMLKSADMTSCVGGSVFSHVIWVTYRIRDHKFIPASKLAIPPADIVKICPLTEVVKQCVIKVNGSPSCNNANDLRAIIEALRNT